MKQISLPFRADYGCFQTPIDFSGSSAGQRIVMAILDVVSTRKMHQKRTRRPWHGLAPLKSAAIFSAIAWAMARSCAHTLSVIDRNLQAAMFYCKGSDYRVTAKA